MIRAVVLAPGHHCAGEAETLAHALIHEVDPHVVIAANLAFLLAPDYVDEVLMLDWQCAREYEDDWWPYRNEITLWGGIDAAKMYTQFQPWESRAPRIIDGEMEGLSRDHVPIHHKSTGHACIAHAITVLGATEVHLLGFTLNSAHFHGDHTGLCEKKASRQPVNLWLDRHRLMARDAERMGITILNRQPPVEGELPLPYTREALDDRSHANP